MPEYRWFFSSITSVCLDLTQTSWFSSTRMRFRRAWKDFSAPVQPQPEHNVRCAVTGSSPSTDGLAADCMAQMTPIFLQLIIDLFRHKSPLLYDEWTFWYLPHSCWSTLYINLRYSSSFLFLSFIKLPGNRGIHFQYYTLNSSSLWLSRCRCLEMMHSL